MRTGRIIFGIHAIQRMFERGIGVAEVLSVLESGKIIESYPSRKPYPVDLILGWMDRGAIHVAIADNRVSDETIVVTVYEPDPDIWEPGFERRKQ